MADTVSKEMLKTALAELAQTDREFFVALVSDALALAAASAEAGTTPMKPAKKNRRKPLPAKVKPAYRQDTADVKHGNPVDKSAIVALRELFADEQSADEIIATFTK